MTDQPPAASDIVERVETVSYANGYAEPDKPIWRIVLNGYCADFDSEQAARNFGAEITRLRAALRECADDLETEIKARYPAQVQIYPSEKRRFDRDMEMVRRARELLK